MADGFHIKDGWTISRQPGGAVSLKTPCGGGLLVDADTWASIVASVSKRGGGADTFGEAMSLHLQPRPGTGIE